MPPFVVGDVITELLQKAVKDIVIAHALNAGKGL